MTVIPVTNYFFLLKCFRSLQFPNQALQQKVTFFFSQSGEKMHKSKQPHTAAEGVWSTLQAWVQPRPAIVPQQ